MARGVFWTIVAAGLMALLGALHLDQNMPLDARSSTAPDATHSAQSAISTLVAQLGEVWDAVLISLAGAFAGFVAAERGTRIGFWSGWSGIIAALVMVAIAMFPRISSSVIDHSEPLSGAFWMASAAFRISIGLTVCLCGASALFGYDRWRKGAALGITLATLAAMVLFLHEIITLGPLLRLAYFLTPLVGLALLAAASLPRMAACAILVGGGAISLTITYQGFVSAPVVVVDTFQDTYFIVAHNQYLISVFGIFTLLGALTVWTQPRLPVWVISLLASLILLGQVASYAPMVFLGRMGMPRRYVDYDDSIALRYQISTFGAMVMILALTILLVLIWLRRTR